MISHDQKPPVTIYEIAKHVGVSAAAVSSVLSNRHVERRISAGTVQRVRDAIQLLGYVPNMAGRRLRSHKRATRQFDLAILTSFEAPLPLVGQILRALQAEADRRTTEHTRYAVGIEMFHAGKLAEKPGLLDADRYHGVIITNTLPEDDAFLAKARLPFATVVLGRRIPGYHCVLEVPDFVGRRSAEVLIDAGCEQLAVLHGKQLTQATAERVSAFQRTAVAHHKPAPVSIACDSLQPKDAISAMEKFLAEGGKCDGLFAVTDSLAVGAYKVFQQRKMTIPTDVAVVGVGDYELAEFFTPPLSTLAGANDAMVAEAVPLLFQQLIKTADDGAPREILVVPPVYLRGSTDRSR